MSITSPLKIDFETVWIGPIRSKSKTKTLRYAPEEDFIPAGTSAHSLEGFPIEFVDPDGVCFAMGNVISAWETDAVTFLEEDYEDHPADSLEPLLVRMNEYYESPIHRRTPLIVIEFEVTARIGDYYSNSSFS